MFPEGALDNFEAGYVRNPQGGIRRLVVGEDLFGAELWPPHLPKVRGEKRGRGKLGLSSDWAA